MPAASRRARICHSAGTSMSHLRRVAHRATLRRGLIMAVVAIVALALGLSVGWRAHRRHPPPARPRPPSAIPRPIPPEPDSR